MDVSDVFLFALLADAIGVRVSSVPRLDGDEAQDDNGDQCREELGT